MSIFRLLNFQYFVTARGLDRRTKSVTGFVVINPISGQSGSGICYRRGWLLIVLKGFRRATWWLRNCNSSVVMNSQPARSTFEPLLVSSHSQSRAALLRSARDGNRDALAELVLPYAHGLYRSGLRLTGNVHDAEEVRQETLLKTLTHLDQFAGTQTGARDDLHAWVSRIAANASIDLIRRRREGKIFSIDQSGDSDESLASRIPSKEANPEQGFLRQESRRQLAAAIIQLPPDLRQVCLLLDVLNYSTQEVATRLGISNVAVRLRLFRAHRRLREELSGKTGRTDRTRRVSKNRRPARRNWAAGTRGAVPCHAIGFACGGD
jgi:RNA polymerase sigma factor (sigma-70 family)